MKHRTDRKRRQGTRFGFGCAEALYRDHVHPRVLCGPADIARLKKAVHAGRGRQLMKGLRRRAALLEEAVRDDGRLEERFAGLLERKQPLLMSALIFLHDLAIRALLDEDARGIAAVDRVLSHIARAPHANLTPGWGSNHAWVLAYDLLFPHLTAETRAEFARWIERHAVREALTALRRDHFLRDSGQNTPICIYLINALMTVMALWGDPEVPDLTDARRELILLFEGALHGALGVDGYPAEDIGYGTSVIAGLATPAEALRRAGWYDAYRACPRYARFGQALLHFIQPWGTHLTNTGDHGASMDTREMVLARQAAETGARTLLWLAESISYPPFVSGQWSEGREVEAEVSLGKGRQLPPSLLSLLVLDDLQPPLHPARTKTPTAFRDRDRGIVSFRSDWRADATYVVFDGSQRSPACQGHMHASGGHFSLSALGEYFAIDTGRYNIEQNCHNVVLVDGQSGRSTDGEWINTHWHGNLIEYAPDPFCDSAAADSSHQHNCYWARRWLGLVKGRGAPAYVWTVEDINKANDWAEFWWQLHTSPENTISIEGARAEITGWRHGNKLDVHFALPPPTAYPKAHTLTLAQDLAVPSSHKYVPHPHEKAATYARLSDQLFGPVFERPRLLAKVGGYNGRFLSLLLPRRQGDAPAMVEQLPTLDNALAVRIMFPTVEDTLIFAYEHRLLEAGEIVARGQWCVVRRARKTGRVLAHALRDGTRLEVGGHKI